jgi:hypothetical protein
MRTKIGWIALAATLAGCATGPGYYSPSHPEYRYYDGSDTRAYNEPRYYGDAGPRHYSGADSCQPGLNSGHVVGGVVGGVLGNQVGKGRGRTAATVAGAAIGAVAGGNMARSPECR